ncbi:MAG: uncharacterized protein conserved in archaea [Halonotius sp. J07HN6]|nr:MAG: uncharacterized protein conserved in archaea [Halonotius sp. J07HN6]ERH05637.1 MAG: uncharacterized protein conserved in archaea [Halonotius sp. J07HN4]
MSGTTEVVTTITIGDKENNYSLSTTTTLKPSQDKLAHIMIDRLEKEVDMLERHLQVLRMVIENEPIGIVKMSNETGYPHHKVRYSLRVLEEENLIEPSSQGAIQTDHTQEFVDDLDNKIDSIVDKLGTMRIDDAAEVES